MKNIIQIIDQSGWTGLILYGIIFIAMLLFMERINKKEDTIIVNNVWVKNDYDPIGFRVVFLGCIAFGGLALFFIIKSFVL